MLSVVFMAFSFAIGFRSKAQRHLSTTDVYHNGCLCVAVSLSLPLNLVMLLLVFRDVSLWTFLGVKCFLY